MTGWKERKSLLVQHKEMKIVIERGQIKHSFLWYHPAPSTPQPRLRHVPLREDTDSIF